MNPPANVHRLPDRDAALKSLYDDLAAKNMFPFWAHSSDVTNDEIKQLMGGKKAVPFVWSCADDIEPILNRAVELITMDDSERRSVILINPGLAPKRATVSTMYTAYRLNDANEIMPPHKHSPSAIRFGLKGKGNFTGVDGEDIVFGPGDMVLTPNDTWHNHGTVGNEQALNLSVLDFPLVETLNAVHFDHNYMEEENGKMVQKKQQTARFTSDYSQRIYGYGGLMPRFASKEKRGAGFSSPMFVYRWEMMRELLERHKDWDGDPYDRPDDRQSGVQDHHLLRADAAPGREDAPAAPDGKPAGRAVRRAGLLDRRRPAFRLEAVRHAGGAGRRVVPARQCVGQGSAIPVRRERRADAKEARPLQEMGPHRERRGGAAGLIAPCHTAPPTRRGLFA